MMQHSERDSRRVLVIMAHPDDPEFTSGGTIARWRRHGAWIGYVICTGGDKGNENTELPADELVRTREDEQRAAAASLGVETVEFLRYEDGFLEHTPELRRQLVAAIRRHRPDTVICFDPATRYLGDGYIQHRDHWVSGEATLAAIYPAARNGRTFPELLREGLEPHVVEHVFMTGSNQPTCWIDIAETIDAKIAAMLLHRSQVQDPDGLSAFLRQMARQAGQTAQPPLEYAESYRYIDSTGG
ncbi:MAG TPA: PIG-L deacetylase family protein [Dehalococcoidia bacterium]|nr:PIG-L deacetylase family protein [Dehalococcoidia bacterium]